ncbi:TetR/AcrR family transcriptional regulator [Actinocrispum wychmicini]|uniref:TetR/AcrR family transcriptional regulator n=1 Tax=Actinocrispum wychmicini TaxID=1213861 RepID=UPI001FB6FE97|nr:TetR/AcrR family transcriptional regulator [Actinocrispum wychmicini]
MSATGGYLKGRLRRQDILGAAIEVYAEAGYHGSSLREIAKRAGITHAGLIYYFPTKEALLAAVLEHRDTQDADRERFATTPPGREVLRRFITLAEHNVRNPGVVDLYARLAAEAVAADHPAHEYFQRHYRTARDIALKSFQALADRGELRDGVDPNATAVAFIALMDGLQVQWLTAAEDVDLVGILKSFVDNVLTSPLD